MSNKSRKVFLSFLGTGNYKECKYVSKKKGESRVVEYVQEAILDLYATDFSKDDIAYFFLTEEAETKHWNKLEQRVNSKSYQIKSIKDIPEGYSEEDIWNIFETVFSVLQNEDQVILDVTHGFRSLPMLGIVLLNYAKSLKKIKVQHILYGAFESLGAAYNIEDRIPNPEDRKASLLDLSAFSAIQTWTFGAESFIETGNAKTITDLSLENIRPILIESKGSDNTASNIRNLMKALGQIEMAINTNRGKVINNGNWIQSAQNALDNLIKDDSQVFAPIKPILERVDRKLLDFKNMLHWEAAVKWCIEHNLVQQGITQLQEGIISFIASRNELDSSDLTHREIISQSLNILSQDIDETKWKSPASENINIVRSILNDDFVINHNDNFQRLSEYRNDINHGGYKDKSLEDGSKFKSKLEFIYSEFLKIKSESTNS